MKIFISTILLIFFCCNFQLYAKENHLQGKIVLKSGKLVPIKLALTNHEKIQGLSSLKDTDFPDDSGMLFYYLEDQERVFWMPDTYFDLDIIFLNQDFKILEIIRNVKHYPSKKITSTIPRTPAILCRHVLEIKSKSKIAKEFIKGEKIKITLPSPAEIKSKIHL